MRLLRSFLSFRCRFGGTNSLRFFFPWLKVRRSWQSSPKQVPVPTSFCSTSAGKKCRWVLFGGQSAHCKFQNNAFYLSLSLQLPSSRTKVALLEQAGTTADARLFIRSSQSDGQAHEAVTAPLAQNKNEEKKVELIPPILSVNAFHRLWDWSSFTLVVLTTDRPPWRNAFQLSWHIRRSLR